MLPLRDLQRAFAEAVADPRREPPASAISPGGGRASRRFAVYRNNFASSLIEALLATYPATTRLVGEDCFRALARAFIHASPPRSPILFHYGDGFGAFISSFDSLAAYPYLGDVARVEWAWLSAYHSADAEPLTLHGLAELLPERLVEAALKPHPAMRLVRSRWPVVTLWAATRAGVPPSRLPEGGEDALVTRPDMEVEVRLLRPGGAVFSEALIEGRTLGEAAGAASAADAGFNLSATLKDVLEAGAFSGLLSTPYLQTKEGEACPHSFTA